MSAAVLGLSRSDESSAGYVTMAPPPTDSGEVTESVFPMRERLTLKDNMGMAFQMLREMPVFKGLGHHPWSLFRTIATYWQLNAVAWPSQETLEESDGTGERTIRDSTRTLEVTGILRTWEVRGPKGAKHLRYAPGPVTIAGLAEIAKRFPNRRLDLETERMLRGLAKTQPTSPTLSPPPAGDAGRPPASGAGKHREDQRIEPSSCVQLAHPERTDPSEEEKSILDPGAERGGETARTPEPPPPSPSPLPTTQRVPTESAQGVVKVAAVDTESQVSTEDLELARIILGEHRRRLYPDRPPPTCFTVSELLLPAMCAKSVEGDRETKLERLRDSLHGAFLVSKVPPTSRYIWEKIGYFDDHAVRGKKAREDEAKEREKAARKQLARELAKQNPPPPPLADRETTLVLVAGLLDVLGAIPDETKRPNPPVAARKVVSALDTKPAATRPRSAALSDSGNGEGRTEIGKACRDAFETEAERVARITAENLALQAQWDAEERMKNGGSP